MIMTHDDDLIPWPAEPRLMTVSEQKARATRVAGSGGASAQRRTMETERWPEATGQTPDRPAQPIEPLGFANPHPGD